MTGRRRADVTRDLRNASRLEDLLHARDPEREGLVSILAPFEGYLDTRNADLVGNRRIELHTIGLIRQLVGKNRDANGLLEPFLEPDVMQGAPGKGPLRASGAKSGRNDRGGW